MLRATRRIEGVIRERFAAEFDTTLPRFDVMAALHRSPQGMMMSELSRFLLVSNGNVTGIVGRLAADGLVVRALRDGDRRAAVVRLTKVGEARFLQMAAAHRRWIDELMAGVDEAEAEAVSATLSAFHNRWEGER